MATTKDTVRKAQIGDTNGMQASEATDGLLEGFEWAGTKNVQWQMQGHILVIAIDTTKQYGLSASGKSHSTASTGGFKPIGDTGVSVNLNVNKMIPKADRGKQK